MDVSKEKNKDIKDINNIIAMSQDPIYIGTGGFTIGRVDNTIVRDPITRIPKIPGTSLAGTWRYYMALTLHSYFKEKYRINRNERREVNDEEIKELFDNTIDGWKNNEDWVAGFKGNRYAAIKCAGQDDMPNNTLESMMDVDEVKTSGHCGHCIVCKTFGFSKQDKSQRGMVYFSDLNILLFPVYTRLGTKWITSKGILSSTGIETEDILEVKYEKVIMHNEGNIKSINLGWLNFEVEDKENKGDKKDIIDKIIEELERKFNGFSKLGISKEDIVIVSDNIIHQIINSNLETRTSVSIDPLTGAAKKGALFTSEAIPRGTVFYGNIRIEKHPLEVELSDEQVSDALEDSKKYFETLGIGGMTTRGFGRLKIFDWGGEK